MKNSAPSHSTEISPARKLVFGTLFFFFLLFSLEFLLSFAGLEKYDRLFMPRSSFPIFVAGEGNRSGYYVTSPHFGTYINAQSFLREKPAGLTRIFVVGGSAAYGFPYNAEYGFSGYLGRALDRAAPGRFEVVNASGMSFGSHRVLDVLRDVVLFEPDVVIIYSGNNEYVEKNILPEMKKPPAAVEKVGALFNRTDIYRAVRLVLFKAVPRAFESQVKQDITDIRSDPDVHRGDIGRSPHTDSGILANYRQNITAMKELLVRQGVKVIFCSVPVDIGGWLPTSGVPRFADEAAARKWLELEEARDQAFQRGDVVREAELMRQILEITPDDPGMRFNYGKILWSLGRYQESYGELVRAKDDDYRPTRALSSFNQVIRSLADEKNGVYLADLENMVKEKFLQGQARGIFLDYCHLTETGDKMVAQWLLPVLAKAVTSLPLDIPLLSGMISEDTRAETKSDYVRGHELYAMALTFENNNRPDLAEKTYLEALKYLPEFDQIYANLGHIYVDMDDMNKAVDMYNRSLQLDPDGHQVLLALGYMSIQENRFDDAERYFMRAISISSILPGAYAGLGDVAMQRRDFQKAVAYYNDSLRLGQDSVWLRKSLAQAYLSLGDTEQAVQNWKNALQFNPLDQEARDLVRRYSGK